MSRITVLITREEFPLETFAIVSAQATDKIFSILDLQEALIQAVNDWVRYTEEGAACYRYAGNDLNIGDLASYVDSDTFKSYLKQHQIYDFKIECAEQDPHSWSYDTVLVDSIGEE